MHHQIELKLDVTPTPVKLSEDREVKVTITVYNQSKKSVHLDFPTSQRIEILVRDASGKVVNTWSEDQSFTDDSAAVTVNPGERLEYAASVATREMTGGQPYTIEASFPSDAELKIQQQVIPQK
jgi:Intracellular proteinase inhibitor